MNQIRNDLRAIFQSAVDAVSGKNALERVFEQGGLPDFFHDSFHVVAIGKAADAMLQGVPDSLIKTGLLISKQGHISKATKADVRIQSIESSHPVPDFRSLEAGQALLEFLQNLPENEPCLFLISGGTSALVEVLQGDTQLADLEKLNQQLLSQHYPIDQINQQRRKLSKIKGGGLWAYLNNRPVSCLLISDVPDDDPQVIGSGLLFPYPESVDNLFSWQIVASLNDAKLAAEQKAIALGYATQIMPNFLEGDAELAAKNCVQQIQENPNKLMIWGGETTVNLPENAGKGGRNQHLALSAAIQLNGKKDCVLLAAGTDGTDGNTTATGAIVDGQTLAKGKALNCDAYDYLRRADSHQFLSQTDELIITGATGTNVMDLVIGFCKH